MSVFTRDENIPIKEEVFYPDLSEDGADLDVTLMILNEPGKRFEIIDSQGNLAAVSLGPTWGPVNQWLEIALGPVQGSFKLTSSLGVLVRVVAVAPVT